MISIKIVMNRPMIIKLKSFVISQNKNRKFKKKMKKNREKLETDISIERILGVFSFSGFACVLEEQDTIEFVLLKIHGI